MTRRHLTIAMAALLAACSSSTEPGVDPDLVSIEVGPAGGSLQSSDGRLTVTVPAGAVGSVTTLTVTPLEASELGPQFAGLSIGGAYELGPSGQTFNQPLTIRLLTNQPVTVTDSTVSFMLEALMTIGADTLEQFDSVRVEASGDSVFLVGRLSHFSPVVRVPFESGEIRLSGVPASAELGIPFVPVLVATAPFLSSDDQVRWIDQTKVVSDRLSHDHAATGIFPAGSGGSFTQPLDYRCVGLGTASIVLRVVFTLPFGGALESDELTRAIECLPPSPKAIDIVLIGTGTGTVQSDPLGIMCGNDCQDEYSHGMLLHLFASAASGSEFVAWGGDCSGTEPGISVIMSMDRICTAQFDLEPVDACQPTVLDYGESANGSWGDCTEGSRFVESFDVTVEQQASTLNVTSSSIHYAELIGPNGQITDFGDPSPLDGPKTVILPLGTYEIRVSRTTSATGTFTIEFGPAVAPLENCTSAEATAGIDFALNITSTDCAGNSVFGAGTGQMYYKFFFVTEPVGAEITVTLSSAVFNPALALQIFHGDGTLTTLANSNPGNAGSVSMTFTIEAGKRYCLVLTSTGATRGPNQGAAQASIVRSP